MPLFPEDKEELRDQIKNLSQRFKEEQKRKEARELEVKFFGDESTCFVGDWRSQPSLL